MAKYRYEERKIDDIYIRKAYDVSFDIVIRDVSEMLECKIIIADLESYCYVLHEDVFMIPKHKTIAQAMKFLHYAKKTKYGLRDYWHNIRGDYIKVNGYKLVSVDIDDSVEESKIDLNGRFMDYFEKVFGGTKELEIA